MIMNKTKLGVNRNSVFILLAIAVLIPIVSGGNEYISSVSCFLLMYIIAVSGIDILFGYCGQISMGHAAFYAIGAYVSALLHNILNIPVIFTMFIASAFAAVVGAILAYPASKLLFHFLSLATMSFGEIVYQVAMNSPNRITGNAVGLFTEKLTLFGFRFGNFRTFYFFALACAIIFVTLKVFLVSGKTGRAFMAIRENTHAAAGMGINVRAYKVKAFTVSAFYTAFAGAMYMHIVGFVYPEMFIQKQSVLFITMLLFGGSGNFLGPIIGSASVMVVTESIRSLREFQMITYGVLLLIVIIALPGGLYGAVQDLISNMRHKYGKNSNNGGGSSSEESDVVQMKG